MNERVQILLDLLPELEHAGRPGEAIDVLLENARVAGTSKKDWPSEEAYLAIKDGLTELRDKRLKPLKELLEPDEGRSRFAAEEGLKLARIVTEAVETFAASKAELARIDFDDQLLKVRDLLRDGPSHVRETVANSISLLLVDEFQDTDAVQAEILRLLAGSALRDGRLFLVGDSKQSIYRFRGAHPAIFDEFRAEFPDPGRLDLTENFRSVPGLLNFVNALFADEFPGVANALKPGGGTEDIAGQDAVLFLWAGRDGEKADAATKRQEEARGLARLIAGKLRDGWLVRDRSTGAIRRASAGDVALLFRSMADVPEYERALATEGLDYLVLGGSSYFAQQEVIDLINVLSSIEDPCDSIALAGTLRGPFFGVSDSGLFWLAEASSGDFVSGLDRLEAAEALSPEDLRRLRTARESLGRWRERKDLVPIADLLETILDESGFEPALLGEFLGDRKRANVRKLVRMARAFDSLGTVSLADFVARLRADLDDPPREEQAATADETAPAVKLMTIHAAKGLEFPIVALPDLDRDRPRTAGIDGSAGLHPELGPLVRPPEDDETGEERWSLGWELFKAIEANAEEDEALRVFYVAATRARDVLILSAGSAPGDSPRSPAMRLLASRFDRQTGLCSADLPSGWADPRIGIVAADDPDESRRPRPANFRPKLLNTIARILAAPSPSDEPAESKPPRPRFFDLDPSRTLPTELRPVERLIRAVLNDPDGLSPENLPLAIERAALSGDELVPRRAEIEAHRRLDAFLGLPLAKTLRRTRHRIGEWPWTIARADGTVVRGRIDVGFRDRDGRYHLIGVAVSEADVPRARRNLALASSIAEAQLGPVGGRTLLVLGDRGPRAAAIDPPGESGTAG